MSSGPHAASGLRIRSDNRVFSLTGAARSRLAAGLPWRECVALRQQCVATPRTDSPGSAQQLRMCARPKVAPPGREP
jgi:hypothetical protein